MGDVIKIGKKSEASTANMVKQFFKDSSVMTSEDKDRVIDYIYNDFVARATGDTENTSAILTKVYNEMHKKDNEQREKFMEKSKKAEELYTPKLRDDIIIALIDCIEYNATCIPNSNPFQKGAYDIRITAVDTDKFADKAGKIFLDAYPNEDKKIIELLVAYALREAQKVDLKLYNLLSENDKFMEAYNKYVNTPRDNNTMKEFTFMIKTSREIIELCKSIVDEGKMRLYASVL